MRWMVAMLALLMVLCVGCPSGISGDRLKEINSEWYRIYNADRGPTEAEVAAYSALDEAGKKAWEEAGKPVLKPLNQRMIDAAEDYKEAIDAEAEANK